MADLQVVREHPDEFNPRQIRIGRQSRGMPLAKLAEAIGLTPRQLQWVEQGKMALPKDALPLLSMALHYPLSFFRMEDLPSGGVLFTCWNSDERIWAEVEAEQAERREVVRLRKRVKELEAQLAEKR